MKWGLGGNHVKETKKNKIFGVAVKTTQKLFGVASQTFMEMVRFLKLLNGVVHVLPSILSAPGFPF